MRYILTIIILLFSSQLDAAAPFQPNQRLVDANGEQIGGELIRYDAYGTELEFSITSSLTGDPLSFVVPVFPDRIDQNIGSGSVYYSDAACTVPYLNSTQLLSPLLKGMTVVVRITAFGKFDLFYVDPGFQAITLPILYNHQCNQITPTIDQYVEVFASNILQDFLSRPRPFEIIE